MPSFGLKNIKAAQYVNTNGTISYTGAVKVGDAMSANIELRFAEGRLYAEDSLAEYLRKAVGGTISLAVKYIKNDAQALLFGMRTKARTVNSTEVSGLVIGGHDTSKYVGVAFYAPDMIDGVEKFTCVLIKKTMFGPPSMSLQTAGDNIAFNTPTTSGEFLADNSESLDFYEVAVVDTEATAKAWVDAVLA